MLFSSGMAAATAVFQALNPGDHIVASKVMYWALRSWLMTEALRWGLKVDFVETDNLDALKAAVKPGETKLVWVETPSNPLWSITDIAAAAEIAHAAGARLAVDSTTASPFHTRPLTLGADIVMHAATKVLNGHSDVVAGALAGAKADEFWTRVASIRKMQGAILGPFEAYLLMRGMRTLHVRAAAQAKSALDLAQRFSAHPKVARVLYPGLESHPQHALAARQMSAFGGIVTAELDRDLAGARRMLERVRIFALAESLGGVESLIEHPGIMTHATIPAEQRGAIGISDSLIRISAGIEEAADLIADLDQALAA